MRVGAAHREGEVKRGGQAAVRYGVVLAGTPEA